MGEVYSLGFNGQPVNTGTTQCLLQLTRDFPTEALAVLTFLLNSSQLTIVYCYFHRFQWGNVCAQIMRTYTNQKPTPPPPCSPVWNSWTKLQFMILIRIMLRAIYHVTGKIMNYTEHLSKLSAYCLRIWINYSIQISFKTFYQSGFDWHPMPQAFWLIWLCHNEPIQSWFTKWILIWDHDSGFVAYVLSVYAPPGQSINYTNFIFWRYIT